MHTEPILLIAILLHGEELLALWKYGGLLVILLIIFLAYCIKPKDNSKK